MHKQGRDGGSVHRPIIGPYTKNQPITMGDIIDLIECGGEERTGWGGDRGKEQIRRGSERE